MSETATSLDAVPALQGGSWRLHGVPARLLLALGVGLLLAELNESVFMVALPTVVGDLHGGGQLVGVNTAYVAAACAGMLGYGRLGDRYGRPRVFAAALALFLVGSVVGGLATEVPGVVAARALQGLGGGGMLVLVQALLADLVPARERAPYLSAVGVVFAIAAVLGPPLGGWLTETAGWRWVFWMNVPLSGIALLVVWRLRSRAWASSAGGRIPSERGLLWPAGSRPDANVWVCLIAAFLTAVVAFGVVGYLPTYLQYAVGLAPGAAGRWMLVLVAGLALSTLGSAQWVRRTGRYQALPIAGCAALALALLLLSRPPADGSRGTLATALFLFGAGLGGIVEVLLVVVQNEAPPAAVGTATAAYAWCRELGVTLGALAVGTLFTHRLSTLLAERLPYVGAVGLDPTGLTPARVDGLAAPVRAVVAESYADALAPVLLGLIPLLALAAAALAFLRPVPLATLVPVEMGQSPDG